mgnify:CR=1 FL=1
MKKIIIIFTVLISLNIYSENNLFELYFLYKKEAQTEPIKNVHLAKIVYKLGNKEKSLEILNNYLKSDKSINIDEVYNILLGDFDDETVKNLKNNYIELTKNNEVKPEISKKEEILKDDFIKTETQLKQPEENKKEIHTEIHDKNHKNNKISQVQLAVVFSEYFDDMDIENMLTVLYNFLVEENYINYQISTFYAYLLYNSNYKEESLKLFENIENKYNSPELYHYLYDIFINTNTEKANYYKDLIEQKYPFYLKYNKL